MADLTKQTEINQEWKNVSTALAMADGTSYLVDALGVNEHAIIYTAETDDAAGAPSAGVSGHPWVPFNRARQVEARIYPKRAGAHLWARVDNRTATLVATLAS